MKTREEMLELLSEYIEHLIGSEVMKSKDTAGVEKQMRDLRLYECNRKKCGDKCSHDISGCHLT